MISIYAPWCPGLSEDKEALAIIRDSKILTGIETCDADSEIDRIKAAGVKYNLHNPLFKEKIGLDCPQFVTAFTFHPKMLEYCNGSSPPALSFHTGYDSIENKNCTKEYALNNTLHSIKFLDSVIQKKIIFESTTYSPKYFETGHKETASYVTSPNFFKDIFSKSKAGFLFDIAHNLVSGSNKIVLGEYNGTIEDYFSDILRVVAKETYQIHLNVVGGDLKKGFTDEHEIIKPSQKNSKLVLSLAKEIIGACPNLKTITLEMYTKKKPVEHAKLMIKQAELVKNELDI
jgi:hypothetical protein